MNCYYKIGGGFLILAISVGGLLQLTRKLPTIQRTLFSSKQKQKQKQKPIDRLSELPQEIVDIVLARFMSQPVLSPTPLPSYRRMTSYNKIIFTTKYVIRYTSILSKRWRYAWTTCPTLIFIAKEFSSNQSFIKFVNKTLEIRGNSPLKTFELYWTTGRVNQICVSKWLQYAVQCNVEEIVLQLYNVNVLELPASLFCCPTLKALDILTPNLSKAKESWTRCSVPLPNSMNLKNLISLDLQFVKCPCKLLEKLISSCPLLESLKLGTCDDSLEISAPNLKSLHLYHTKGPVQISAPKLEALCCILYTLAEISTEDFKFLTHAFVWDFRKLKENGSNLMKLLKSLSNAKVLELRGHVIESLSKLDTTEQIFPIFYNLKHLRIATFSLSMKIISVIIMLVHRCPILEKLVFFDNYQLDT